MCLIASSALTLLNLFYYFYINMHYRTFYYLVLTKHWSHKRSHFAWSTKSGTSLQAPYRRATEHSLIRSPWFCSKTILVAGLPKHIAKLIIQDHGRKFPCFHSCLIRRLEIGNVIIIKYKLYYCDADGKISL